MLGNQFSRVTMYSNGDADAYAAADARCGYPLRMTRTIFYNKNNRLAILVFGRIYLSRKRSIMERKATLHLVNAAKSGPNFGSNKLGASYDY